MSTISASTTSTTGFKVTSDTTGTLVFQTGASPTTAMTLGSDQSVTFAGAQTYTGAATFTTGISVQGLTVGKGAGAVSTNTAVGASALAANTSGAANTSVGNNALAANTTGNNNHAFGQGALQANTTGGQNVAIGRLALAASNADSNTAVGHNALTANTSGASNTAFGLAALVSNTTASNNTAVGYQAAYSNTTGTRTIAIGYQAAYTNSTSNYNLCIGYQAGYNTTGQGNVLLGDRAGYSLTTGYANTFVGPNWSAGGACGENVTTGYKNTIIGAYNGNQGGLDIRTANNYIVLSDGDGTPWGYQTNGVWTLGYPTTASVQYGRINLQGSNASGYGPIFFAYANGSEVWSFGSNSNYSGSTDQSTFRVRGGTGNTGVLLTSGATSWSAASDERLKDVIEPITDAANKVATLRAVIGKYKTDEEGIRRSFLIAQDVEAVLPEAVTKSKNSKEDETEYLNVAYTEVIPLLVAAIKELKAEIDTLKGQA